MKLIQKSLAMHLDSQLMKICQGNSFIFYFFPDNLFPGLMLQNDWHIEVVSFIGLWSDRVYTRLYFESSPESSGYLFVFFQVQRPVELVGC